MAYAPRGIISIWSGAIVDIPEDWVLCDGTQGTPDLTNRFVMGPLNEIQVGGIGGSLVHNHDFTTDGHFHVISEGTDLASGAGKGDETYWSTDSGTTDNASGLPPWYALAFIMKT